LLKSLNLYKRDEKFKELALTVINNYLENKSEKYIEILSNEKDKKFAKELVYGLNQLKKSVLEEIFKNIPRVSMHPDEVYSEILADLVLEFSVIKGLEKEVRNKLNIEEEFLNKRYKKKEFANPKILWNVGRNLSLYLFIIENVLDN